MRVDDGISLREGFPRQVMVCDENLETGLFGGIDALMT